MAQNRTHTSLGSQFQWIKISAEIRYKIDHMCNDHWTGRLTYKPIRKFIIINTGLLSKELQILNEYFVDNGIHSFAETLDCLNQGVIVLFNSLFIKSTDVRSADWFPAFRSSTWWPMCSYRHCSRNTWRSWTYIHSSTSTSRRWIGCVAHGFLLIGWFLLENTQYSPTERRYDGVNLILLSGRLFVSQLMFLERTTSTILKRLNWNFKYVITIVLMYKIFFIP